MTKQEKWISKCITETGKLHEDIPDSVQRKVELDLKTDLSKRALSQKQLVDMANELYNEMDSISNQAAGKQNED